MMRGVLAPALMVGALAWTVQVEVLALALAPALVWMVQVGV